MPDIPNKQALQNSYEQASLYFSLLAEPTRLKILSMLVDGESTVTGIVDTIDAGQTNVSRQLGLLYRGNILARRKEGTRVYYSLRDEATIALCRGICRHTVMTEAGATTCRRPDNSCRVGPVGAECRWQPSNAKAHA